MVCICVYIFYRELLVLEDFFKTHSDDTGLPIVPEQEWQWVLKEYGIDVVKKELAKHIVTENVPFPYRKISKEKMESRFRLLRKKDMESLLIRKGDRNIHEKYDFRYNFEEYGIYAISIGNAYNAISDYFQNRLRMKCGSHNRINVVDRWESGNKIDQLLAPIFRFTRENKHLHEESYRKALRLNSYVASQFRPSSAKFLYEVYDAKIILDTSMGWGDRLAGFWLTPTALEYVGFDPNPYTFEVYKEQCFYYHKLLGGGTYDINEMDSGSWEFISEHKTVRMFRKPSEDVDWDSWKNYFDFMFTSPPYFSTEKYNEGGKDEEDQSWKRYDTFEKWKYDFFIPTMKRIWCSIKDDGFMGINITEPKVGKVLELCDDFVDSMISQSDCNFLGQVGMRMMQRPNVEKYDKSEEKKDFYDRIFTEPIWFFRKNNTEPPELFPCKDLTQWFV